MLAAEVPHVDLAMTLPHFVSRGERLANKCKAAMYIDRRAVA